MFSTTSRTMNENYAQPDLPGHRHPGVLRGAYLV